MSFFITSKNFQQLSLSVIPTTLLFGFLTNPADALNISRLSSFETGLQQGSEISAYDPDSQRLFITNGATNVVDIVSISNPQTPTKINQINLTSLGGFVNSVAVKNGIVAAAIQGNTVTDPGIVALFDVNGNLLNSVTVGALPDMLTFTLDGSKILVANEGEPSGGINPEGSVSIIDLLNGVNNATVNTANFTAFNGTENALRTQGVRIFPGINAANDFEPEYITLSPDGSTAWVSLQEANTLAVLDIASATITDLLPLGTKDHSIAGQGIDPSDRDNAINIRTVPLRGLYQPDAIATINVGSQTYIVTANEGDTRTENIRIGNSSVVLDPTVFPNASTLKQNANLGRLEISSIDGDIDGDGDFDALYSYGARSFSIWDINGNLIFDSGDDFEQITAALFPSIFNADRDAKPVSFDNRSDNKGPEPEGLAVGKVGDRLYSFVGLERIGGFMVYDITDPNNPIFVQYQNDTALGDLSPEGLLFIPAKDSPNGQSLLILTNEESGNTSIYSVTSTPESTSILGLIMLGFFGVTQTINNLKKSQ